MCVDTAWVRYGMLPPIRELHDAHRTVSLSGNNGRDVAYDLAQEDMNRECKTGLYAGGKRCDIDSLIVQLNGTRGATEKLFAALGLESRVREDSRVTSTRDVDALLADLREAHPPDQFFATSDATPLWTAPQAPATDLRSGHRPAGQRRTPSERVHAERADLRSYVERRLDNPLLDE